MKPEDEFIHPFPQGLKETWKENWYFNFIDQEQGIWGFNHLSLVRNKGKARFTAAHVIDSVPRVYSNVIPIDEGFEELTDGSLTIRCLEPLKSYQVDFRGPEHSLCLHYEGRLPVYDYGKGLEDSTDSSLSMSHYEQSCRVKGTFTQGNEERPINCLGQRDHSWGYREESKIIGWNWVVAQFKTFALNLMITRKEGGDIIGGFISAQEGNIPIPEISVRTDFEEDGENPKSSFYKARAEDGRIIRLETEKFSQIRLPVQKGSFVFENFSLFTLLDTGEKGIGVEEHLYGQKKT